MLIRFASKTSRVFEVNTHGQNHVDSNLYKLNGRKENINCNYKNSSNSIVLYSLVLKIYLLYGIWIKIMEALRAAKTGHKICVLPNNSKAVANTLILTTDKISFDVNWIFPTSCSRKYHIAFMGCVLAYIHAIFSYVWYGRCCILE